MAFLHWNEFQPMLTKRSKRPNPPHVRAKRVSGLAVAIAALGATALVLLFHVHIANALGASAEQARAQRAVFVAYMDDPNDERGWLTYRCLTDALDAAGASARVLASVEFVQALVGGQPTFDDLMRRLVESQPAAIVATSDDVLQAAKAATQSIPILFLSYADPVVTGEVRSIAAPGVNRTGFTFHAPMLAKSIEIILDGYPRSKHIGVLVNSLTAREPGFLRELREARAGVAVRLDVFVADDAREVAKVLHEADARSVDAWFVPTGPALWNDQAAVIGMMAGTSKPVLYDRIRFVRNGGLMAYEARIVDPIRIWANQLLMIAEGVDVATIPIERPSAFDLAVNLDAVRADPMLRPSKPLLRRANVLVASHAGAGP
jgi:putative ABC transport system substrate-binding protein